MDFAIVFKGTKLQLLLEFITHGIISLSVTKKYYKQGWKIYEIMQEVTMFTVLSEGYIFVKDILYTGPDLSLMPACFILL